MYIKAPFGSTILLNCPKSPKTNALYNKLTIAGMANNIEPKYLNKERKCLLIIKK